MMTFLSSPRTKRFEFLLVWRIGVFDVGVAVPARLLQHTEVTSSWYLATVQRICDSPLG